jgi:hypothetical protein
MLGPATARKVVVIEVNGTHVAVAQTKADGTTKRTAKELKDEAQARAECERLVADLLSHGYAEQTPTSVAPKARPVARPAAPATGTGEGNIHALLDEELRPAEPAGAVLPRVATKPSSQADSRSESTPAKKKKGGKKKRKKDGADDLDKRVLAGVAAVVLVLVGLVGYIAYDVFLKPASIVGTWEGTMVEHEIGHGISQAKYRMVLDEQKNASLTLETPLFGKVTQVGTYEFKGDRLKLHVKDESDDKDNGPAADKAETEKSEVKKDEAEKDEVEKFEREMSDRVYKVALKSVTLDLYDPSSGKLLVQLLRFREPPKVGKTKGAPVIAKPGDMNETIDKAADDRLASVDLGAKDGSFRIRHPKGWKVESGARPDNTYARVNLTNDSATISAIADVAGSLMSGSAVAGDYSEGSESAPVHRAHALNQKNVADEFSDYKESAPAVLKGSTLGEGRIATFTASGGLFGSRIRGYRVTLLTNDRRVSVVCQCPEKEFPQYKPTFLAVCRSLSR